ncbi:hypothetical protein ACX84Z_07570, partial [Burkholderia pseudomallei]
MTSLTCLLMCVARRDARRALSLRSALPAASPTNGCFQNEASAPLRPRAASFVVVAAAAAAFRRLPLVVPPPARAAGA